MPPIRSMTGFAQQTSGEIEITIKSVNHRHFDLHWQVPPAWEALVPAQTLQLRASAARGRIDVRLNDSSVPFRRWRWRQRPAPPSAFPQTAFAAALAQWNAAREAEGAFLSADIANRIEHMEAGCAEATLAAEDALAALRSRPATDPAQIALLLERADITEELVRLAAHLRHARALVAAGGEIGRKLDFLAQELSREASTLLAKPTGSSPAALRLAEIGLDMKAEIDKIREQAQNLE